MKANNICLAVLASGRSSRFGDADKLAAPLHGKMLGLHASDMLAPFGFARSLVVARSTDHPCAHQWLAQSYEVLANPEADEGMAASIRIAAHQAKSTGAHALMIALADMPLVSVAHISKILGAFDADDPNAIVASTQGTHRCPPALFGCGRFVALQEIQGDIGGRQLFGQAQFIEADAVELADVDTPDDLARLARL